MPGIVELKIKLDLSTMQMMMEGPMQDSIMFLGMLEMAKVTFIEMRAKANKRDPVIEIPKLVLHKA